jgi:hypothetical protein
MPGSSGGVIAVSDNGFASAAISRPGNERHQIGARHDMQRFDIARHNQGNAPLQPFAAEPFVDQVHILAADHDGDVACVEENIAPAELRANDNDYCLVFRLENGKIKEVREYCDSVLTEKVLGPFPKLRKLAAG